MRDSEVRHRAPVGMMGRWGGPSLDRWASFAHRMTRYIKSTLIIVAGICWLAFALVIGFFLFQYLGGGAGFQLFGFFEVSSTTVLIGVVHVVGLGAAACLCFVIGVGLCAYGLGPAPERQRKRETRTRG